MSWLSTDSPQPGQVWSVQNNSQRYFAEILGFEKGRVLMRELTRPNVTATPTLARFSDFDGKRFVRVDGVRAAA